jgi:hypothetical protein
VGRAQLVQFIVATTHRQGGINAETSFIHSVGRLGGAVRSSRITDILATSEFHGPNRMDNLLKVHI